MNDYRKGAHTLFDCKYHLVWVTKYRYQVLRDAVGFRVREIAREVCARHNVQILKGHVSTDHVHMHVSIPPNIAVSKFMQYLKGKSSHRLQSEFKHLKKRYWGQHLWARGFFVATTGTVSDEVIQKYIEGHEIRDEKDEFSVVGVNKPPTP